jgi:hypothetical protein
VAPLTTTVLNAVAPRQTGIASGINNAVASVASLLAVALLGTIAITAFDRSLDRHLAAAHAPAEVRQAVEEMRGGLVVTASQGAGGAAARRVAQASLLEAFRLVTAIAAGAALAAALAAALMLRGAGPPGRRAG